MPFIPNLLLPAAPCCASVDRSVADWFRANLTPATSALFGNASNLACGLWVALVILALVGFLCHRRSWRRLALLLLAVPGGSLLAESLKLLVQRPRPFESGPFGIWGGYSFPSGHTTAATLLYGFVLLSLLPLLAKRRWRWFCRASAALLILTVAISRVALGAHYLSDVLAAMLLSSAWLFLCFAIVNRVTFRPAPAPTPHPSGTPDAP